MNHHPTPPHHPSRRRATAAGTLAGAAALLALAFGATGCSDAGEASATPPAPTTRSTEAAPPPARPTGMVDRQVAVDGGDLHVSCEGTGDTTIVLMAGFTDDATSWEPIRPSLDETARVCSVDRFGTGASDPAPGPQTFETQATALDQALEEVGEPGPYLLVGHSFGGPEAITFAASHLDQVTGIVLLDASPDDWDDVVCSVPDRHIAATDSWVSSCNSQRDPQDNPETLDVSASFDQVARIGDLGDVPLTVLTASTKFAPSGLPEGLGERLDDRWAAGQRRWAQRSSASTLVTVADSGHYIHRDQPQAAIDAIQRLLDH